MSWRQARVSNSNSTVHNSSSWHLKQSFWRPFDQTSHSIRSSCWSKWDKATNVRLSEWPNEWFEWVWSAETSNSIRQVIRFEEVVQANETKPSNNWLFECSQWTIWASLFRQVIWFEAVVQANETKSSNAQLLEWPTEAFERVCSDKASHFDQTRPSIWSKKSNIWVKAFERFNVWMVYCLNWASLFSQALNLTSRRVEEDQLCFELVSNSAILKTSSINSSLFSKWSLISRGMVESQDELRWIKSKVQQLLQRRPAPTQTREDSSWRDPDLFQLAQFVPIQSRSSRIVTTNDQTLRNSNKPQLFDQHSTQLVQRTDQPTRLDGLKHRLKGWGTQTWRQFWVGNYIKLMSLNLSLSLRMITFLTLSLNWKNLMKIKLILEYFVYYVIKMVLLIMSDVSSFPSSSCPSSSCPSFSISSPSSPSSSCPSSSFQDLLFQLLVIKLKQVKH